MNNLMILFLFEHLYWGGGDFRETLYHNFRFHNTMYLYV